jgi:cytochrome c551/c552
MYVAGLIVIVGALTVIAGNVLSEHSNPPVTYTVKWDSPETEQLVRNACYACHSNETIWPWYAYVAPVSFLVVDDVKEGRREMNFSTGKKLEAHEMVEQIEEGDMPPQKFLIMHPEASLTDTQKEQLISGIRATFPR